MAAGARHPQVPQPFLSTTRAHSGTDAHAMEKISLPDADSTKHYTQILCLVLNPIRRLQWKLRRPGNLFEDKCEL